MPQILPTFDLLLAPVCIFSLWSLLSDFTRSILLCLQEWFCLLVSFCNFQSNRLNLFYLFAFHHKWHSFGPLLTSNQSWIQEQSCCNDILPDASMKLIDSFIYSSIHFFIHRLECQPKMSGNLLGIVVKKRNRTQILCLKNFII